MTRLTRTLAGGVITALVGPVAAMAAPGGERPGRIVITTEGQVEDPVITARCHRDREILVQVDEGIVIAGTLSIPTSAGPHAAVLMITGNGPHTRDQVISDCPTFAMIADHLVRQGVAVLRTDARGFGSSSGPDDWEQTTTAERIADNRAVLDFLAAQPEIDADRIVLLGHSEGAMIAAALAASDANPALTVLLATSALPGDEVFASQRAAALVAAGGTEEAAEAVHDELIRFAEFLRTDRQNLGRFQELAIDFMAAHGVPEEEVEPAQAAGLLEGFLHAPWYWHFVATDPADDLRRMHTPVLAVFAGADANVPWTRHLPALTAALAEAGNDDAATVVLPDQDHFFLEMNGRRREPHEPGMMTIATELYDVIDAELSRRGLTGHPCPGAGAVQ